MYIYTYKYIFQVEKPNETWQINEIDFVVYKTSFFPCEKFVVKMVDLPLRKSISSYLSLTPFLLLLRMKSFSCDD